MQTQSHEPHYPRVGAILGTIADWVNRQRRAFAAEAEFKEVGPDEVARIARDLNVTPGELASLVSKGPHAADLLYMMLDALGIDQESEHVQDPRLMRDLQRLCFACDHKGRCARELAAGTAKEHYNAFCPNAYTLKILSEAKH